LLAGLVGIVQRATQGAHLSGQDRAVEDGGGKIFDTLIDEPMVGIPYDSRLQDLPNHQGQT
jgi:hypothetical protein